MLPQQYCLRWKHHHSNVQNMFAQLLEKERFCDVTLYCSPSFASQLERGDTVDPESIKGVSLRAHRVVLAACSELLGCLLGAHSGGEPVLVIDGASPSHVRALLHYMYTGEMSVPRSQLQSLLKTAEELKIKGLTDIRWNNKDEPPDCDNDSVTTTASKPDVKTYARNHREEARQQDNRIERDSRSDRDNRSEKEGRSEIGERFSANGGPPPLIKLPTKEKHPLTSPIKREQNSDTEDNQQSAPKRQRMTSGMDHTDDEDRDQEWKHGNLNITAERVVGWGQSESGGSWAGEPGDEPDDEWGDAPADIGSFLHTRLMVDGDNSGEESNEGAPASTSSSVSALDLPGGSKPVKYTPIASKPATIGPKSGPTDPRFTDVIKLNDYLRHGRRPQFWEEDYVKRVMEAIRLKELEMKQAAEILGVSYGTLYGRYRDSYGCINRPFRTARDFWTTKGANEVLDRLKRGDIPMEVAAQALGVSTRDLYVHFHEATQSEKEFEPIPIEIDPSLRLKAANFSQLSPLVARKERARDELGLPATVIATANTSAVQAANFSQLSPLVARKERARDELGLPATVIATANTSAVQATKWRMDRQSSSTSPAGEPSPTVLMKSRPDLTIVAAKKPDIKEEDDS
ncbi:hypothetical protein JYU34_017990 [Plutella xylostella]|uniref:BTB domain-containing protein n=1 Tax=Plutella xylostella TaxID=51655 RepID=A0ABQ7Q389_PLUXY|nr:hypothetical protein JYU34_017990 [Plutella xylostella]